MSICTSKNKLIFKVANFFILCAELRFKPQSVKGNAVAFRNFEKRDEARIKITTFVTA